jgi:hypothetical protein
MLKKWKYDEGLHGGIGFFYTWNLNRFNKLELRPFQGYSLSFPNTDRFVIRHYVRFEQRIEFETNDWTDTFGLRLRYLFALKFKFQGDYWEYGKGFYLPITAEFFWNLIGTRQFNDVVRANIGIGRQFSPTWNSVFLFGYHFTRDSIKEAFDTNDIVFRLRVFYRLK